MPTIKKPTVRIHNIELDEVIDREMNDEEFSAWQLQVLEAEAAKQAEEAKAAARIVTLAKLETLGLTAEDLAAL